MTDGGEEKGLATWRSSLLIRSRRARSAASAVVARDAPPPALLPLGPPHRLMPSPPLRPLNAIATRGVSPPNVIAGRAAVARYRCRSCHPAAPLRPRCCHRSAWSRFLRQCETHEREEGR